MTFHGTSPRVPRSRQAEGTVINLERDFEKAYRENKGRVIWMLLRCRVSRQDVGDVTQAVFIAAARSWGTYDPARGGLAAWLLAIARRKAARYRREAARLHQREQFISDASPDQLEVAVYEPADEGEMSEDEGRKFLQDALRKMPKERREVFEYFYFARITEREIAQFLRLPLGTVKSRLGRAREEVDAAAKRWRAQQKQRASGCIVPISVDALIARERAHIERVPTDDFEQVWKNVQRALRESGPAEAAHARPAPQRLSVPRHAAVSAVRSLVFTAVVSAVVAAGAIGAILSGVTRRPPSEVPPPSSALPDAGTTLIGSPKREVGPPVTGVSAVEADALPDVATNDARATPSDPGRRAPSSKLPSVALPHAEESWIKLARAAIRRGDYLEAEKILDECERGFPHGRLSEERDVLRGMLLR